MEKEPGFLYRYYDEIVILTILVLFFGWFLVGITTDEKNYYIVHDYKVDYVNLNDFDINNVTVSGKIIQFIVDETVRKKNLSNKTS